MRDWGAPVGVNGAGGRGPHQASRDAAYLKPSSAATCASRPATVSRVRSSSPCSASTSSRALSCSSFSRQGVAARALDHISHEWSPTGPQFARAQRVGGFIGAGPGTHKHPHKSQPTHPGPPSHPVPSLEPRVLGLPPRDRLDRGVVPRVLQPRHHPLLQRGAVRDLVSHALRGQAAGGSSALAARAGLHTQVGRPPTRHALCCVRAAPLVRQPAGGRPQLVAFSDPTGAPGLQSSRQRRPPA